MCPLTDFFCSCVMHTNCTNTNCTNTNCTNTNCTNYFATPSWTEYLVFPWSLTKNIRYNKTILPEAQLKCFILIQPREITTYEGHCASLASSQRGRRNIMTGIKPAVGRIHPALVFDFPHRLWQCKHVVSRPVKLFQSHWAEQGHTGHTAVSIWLVHLTGLMSKHHIMSWETEPQV